MVIQFQERGAKEPGYEVGMGEAFKGTSTRYDLSYTIVILVYVIVCT